MLAGGMIGMCNEWTKEKICSRFQESKRLNNDDNEQFEEK